MLRLREATKKRKVTMPQRDSCGAGEGGWAGGGLARRSQRCQQHKAAAGQSELKRSSLPIAADITGQETGRLTIILAPLWLGVKMPAAVQMPTSENDIQKPP